MTVETGRDDQLTPRDRGVATGGPGQGHRDGAEEVLEYLSGRVTELVERVERTLQDEIGEYDPGQGIVTSEAVREAGRRHVGVALAAMSHGGRLDDRAQAELRELARERARRGMPLHALVQACQVGTRVLWDAVLEVMSEVEEVGADRALTLAELSRASLRLTSAVSATVSLTYAEASRHRHVDAERARRDLFEELLSGSSAPPESLRRRAEAVGWQPGEAHVVAVVEALGEGKEGIGAMQLRVVDALRRATGSGAVPLVGTHGTSRTAIFPARPDLSARDAAAALDACLRDARIDQRRYHAAVGNVEPGIAGVARSHRQAAATLELARDRGSPGRTLCYVDSLPLLLLRANPQLAQDLHDDVLAPLAGHDQGELVDTCAVLLQEQGNRVRTARRLHVHRHTLAARLRRMEQLTGRSFDDPDDVLLFGLALRADELITARSSR